MAFKFNEYHLGGGGSGGGSAVLTELTVTENGVYDEPVISNAPEPITWDGVTGEIWEVVSSRDQSYFKVSDRGFTASDLIGATATLVIGGDEGPLPILANMVISFSEYIASVFGEAVYSQGAVVMLVGTTTGSGGSSAVQIPLMMSISEVAPGEETIFTTGTYFGRMTIAGEVVCAKSLTFPATSFTPADGWNKVTVNVAGDIVDVAELPTVNIEEGKIYRVIEESEPILWYRSSGDSNIRSMPLTDYLVQSMGMSLTIHTHIVDVLPDSMEPMDMTTMTMHCYILNSTGVGYVSEDGTSESTVTIGEYLMNSANGGWIDSVNDIQATDKPTIYTLRGGSSVTYGIPNNATVQKFVDGAWVELT